MRLLKITINCLPLVFIIDFVSELIFKERAQCLKSVGGGASSK